MQNNELPPGGLFRGNTMFKMDDCIISTFGTTKGKEFIVKAILKDGFYSCQLKDKSNDTYYQFSNDTAIKKP